MYSCILIFNGDSTVKFLYQCLSFELVYNIYSFWKKELIEKLIHLQNEEKEGSSYNGGGG